MSRILCRMMGNSWKPRFHDLVHESKMRLLKTHSHTSERRGNEAGEIRKKKKMKGSPSLKRKEEIVDEIQNNWDEQLPHVEFATIRLPTRSNSGCRPVALVRARHRTRRCRGVTYSAHGRGGSRRLQRPSSGRPDLGGGSELGEDLANDNFHGRRKDVLNPLPEEGSVREDPFG